MPKKILRSTSAVTATEPVSQSSTTLAVTAIAAAAAGAVFTAAFVHFAPPRVPITTAAQPAAQVPSPPASPPAVQSTESPSPSDATATPVPPPTILLDLPASKVALNMGNWSYDAHNFTAAIVYYQEAIRHGIDTPDLRTDLGNAYRFTGDPPAALQQYQIAHASAPHHENSLFNQGGCYVDLGDRAKATAIWKQYLLKFPNGQHCADARQLIAQATK